MLYLILGTIWFVFTSTVAAVMWACQVGPTEAVSNLSEWAGKFGIENPPEWLKTKSADRVVRRNAAIILAVLLVMGGFLGGMAFEDYLKPTVDRSGGPSASNRWEPLSAQETTILRDVWRKFPPEHFNVLCAIAACADLAESIFNTAHDLNWTGIYSSMYWADHGINQGIEIWSYPVKLDARDKIANSLEHATKGRLKISTREWDVPPTPENANDINLIIGRVK